MAHAEFWLGLGVGVFVGGVLILVNSIVERRIYRKSVEELRRMLRQIHEEAARDLKRMLRP